MRRATLTLALTALVALTAPAGAQAAVSPGAPPQIHRVGPATVRPAGDTVEVSLTYRCKDRPGPAGITAYLQMDIVQAGAERYQVGERNNTGGLFRLVCTGRKRTQQVTLHRNAHGWENLPAPTAGTATVAAQISLHSTPDAGGWYTTTGQSAAVTTRVQVR